MAARVVIDKAASSWQEHFTVIIVADPDQVDTDLADGRVACPHCGARLRPWAHAATRRIRQLDGSTRTLRPRRARCAACLATQVLLPAHTLPRRVDVACHVDGVLPRISWTRCGR